MIIAYSKRSKISAEKIAHALSEISHDSLLTNSEGPADINWGRARADTVLNSYIGNATNKRVAREIFDYQDVPMPRLVDVNNLESDRINPIVGRPDQHTHGRGYWLCKSQEDVAKALKGTRTKKAATHFMEYIEAEHELRVHIFRGKSIRISEKHFEGAEGNHKFYTTIKPTTKRKAVRQAAKAAVEALGLDFGAVDILVDKEGNPYVLEVNTAPGLGGTLPQLYAKYFKEWYEQQD